MTVEYLVILATPFIFGAVFGSLLNVCIYRLPREERFWQALRHLVYPPSSCPRCGERIKWYDNIPILGWLILRGRCRNCRGAISIRYPLIELLTGTLFALLYWFEIPSWWGPVLRESSVYHALGPAGAPWLSPIVMLHLRYVVHMVLIIALIVATFIDIDLRIIPDAVTLPAMAFGVLANWLLGYVYIAPLWYQTPAMGAQAGLGLGLVQILVPRALIPEWLMTWPIFRSVPVWMSVHPHLHGLLVSLAGIVVGGGSIWAVRLVGRWALKREAMGFGDVVLMAMIGSFIGWQGTLIVFVLSLACAVLVAVPQWLIWRDHELPYGPYLSVGTLLLLVSASKVWPWFDTHVFALGPLLIPMALVMALALGGMLFAWRGVQKMLGLAPPDESEMEFEGEWLSGDQLLYLAGECRDDRQGQWPKCEWPGRLSGRGLGQEQVWRCGDCCSPTRPWPLAEKR